MATVLQRQDRAVAALVAAVLVALLLYGLVIGLAVGASGVADSALKLFGVEPPPPPRAVRRVVPHRPSRRPSGEAAPPNLRSRATPVVAPVPVVLLPPPPPVVVAPLPFEGAQATQGAAAQAGPGTGAGGEGDGTGAGGWGNGAGAGDVPPRQVGGRLKDSDYPLAAGAAGVSGTVGVRFVVAVDGRVPRCEVTRSSGSDLLDETTCRLIVRRYRFRPARDARGRPFESAIVQNESWIIERAEGERN